LEKKIALKIKKQIEKAEKKLDSSKLLLDNGNFEDSISRAYYGMYHAAMAVLMTKDLEPPKTHSGLITLFGLHFVKEGIFERKYGKMLSDAKEEREEGDYEIFYETTKQRAEEILTNAKEFLSEVKDFLSTLD